MVYIKSARLTFCQCIGPKFALGQPDRWLKMIYLYIILPIDLVSSSKLNLFARCLYWRNIKELYIPKNYLDPSIFLLYVLISCFHNPNLDFVVKIPLVHIIKFSLTFTDICLNISQILILSLIHKFSVQIKQ